MAKSNRRPLAVLHMKSLKKLGDFIIKMRAIILNIMNHPIIFVTPAPIAIFVFTADVAALETAEDVAKTRVAGAAADRDKKYEKVLDDVHGMQGYVQSLADAAADEVTAIAIIESSGYDLKHHGVRVKPPLSAKNDPNVAGTVLLTAKAAAHRAAYEWEHSPDGVTWITLPSTLQAKTKVDGLATGGHFFRFRAVTKEGEGNWSAAVGLFVIGV